MKPGETLKNCPFCGDVGNLRADVGGPGRDQFWVECENLDCAGMGPTKSSKRAAQRAWNRRTKAELRMRSRRLRAALEEIAVCRESPGEPLCSFCDEDSEHPFSLAAEIARKALGKVV